MRTGLQSQQYDDIPISTSWEIAVSNRRDRIKITIWRFAEASAEGPFAVAGLLVGIGIILAGSALGWW